MQFIDEAKIYVRSGNGGSGCSSFKRAANLPKGGPDGGDGGRGGHIIFEAVAGLNTLVDFRFTQHIHAKNGEHGKGKQRTGATAPDEIIKVPVGTQLFMEDGKTLLHDFTEVGQREIIAKGGDGGLGNMHFKSSTNQAPRRSTKGHAGQEMWLWLKLKLLADVGLAGLPNAGKSTFLSVVSRAKPKIADYPFTTLVPQLGVAEVDGKECVIADIPGLIEGAHEGQGLGHQFLRHIERCQTVLHLIDITSNDVIADYNTIRAELSSYSEELARKPECVALTKCDVADEEMAQEVADALQQECGGKVFLISSAAKQGLTPLLRQLMTQL